MEEDLKILIVEYLSNHCMVVTLDFLGGKLEENSEEFSSVALLSPTCLTLFLDHFLMGFSERNALSGTLWLSLYLAQYIP